MPDLFLDPENIRELCAYCGITSEDQVALLGLAAHISSHPDLLELARRVHHNTYSTWKADDPPTPILETAFGEQAAVLYVLIGLDGMRLIRAAQAKRGVPAAITKASCDAPAVGLRRYRRLCGKIGMDRWVLGWFHYLMGGDLYRLGRLQFIPRAYEAHIVVYEHKRSGHVQAFAVPGQHFDTDGYPINDAQHLNDGVWTSELHEDEDIVSGTPISPHGMALRQPITLKLAEWSRVLGNGDPVLEMHIPDNDPITIDILRDSFAQAAAFFPRYYPECVYKAFVCESWMFNTQLQDMLPDQSSLVQFQKQGYLIPQLAEPEYMLYFIFGRKQVDLTTAPRNTTLRRAVIAHLEAGQSLRNGGWFLLKQDLPHFGQQPYMNK